MHAKKFPAPEIENMSAEHEFTAKKKILVVDDDIDILNWFRMLQKKETPYTFFLLQDELEILKAIAEIKPDLVFIDFCLSEINGKKLSEIIRISNPFAVPVVHMSSRDLLGSEFTENAFMRKPLERKAVDAKIRRLLKI